MQQALSQLQDIHLPAPVSNWPPAYGWWLIALLLLALLLASLWQWRVFRKKRLAKRQALALLSQLDANQPNWPGQLNQLLKRLALSYFPAEQVASHYQHHWLAFLQQQLPDKKQAAFSAVFSPLLKGLYQPASTPPDFAQTMQQSRLWIKHAIPAKANRINRGQNV